MRAWKAASASALCVWRSCAARMIFAFASAAFRRLRSCLGLGIGEGEGEG